MFSGLFFDLWTEFDGRYKVTLPSARGLVTSTGDHFQLLPRSVTQAMLHESSEQMSDV
jgi:hypothetical protein